MAAPAISVINIRDLFILRLSWTKTLLTKNKHCWFAISHFLQIKTVLKLQEFCFPECKPMSIIFIWFSPDKIEQLKWAQIQLQNHYGAIPASWCILVITCTLRPSPWLFPTPVFLILPFFCWPGNGHLPWLPSPTWADLHTLPFKIDTGLWSSIIHPCPIRVTNPWRRQ